MAFFIRNTLRAICAGAVLVAVDASAQQLTYASPQLHAVLDRLERQDAEIQSLRDELHRQRLAPLQSVGHAPNGNGGPPGPDGAFDGPPPPWTKVDLKSKSVRVGGRIFLDHMMFSQDPGHPIADQENRTRFDTARIKVEGDIWENVDYRIQLDFGGSLSGSEDRPTFKDVYITVKELPYVGAVRSGHFKEPVSLDQLTSSRFITFMERSLADTFAPGRNVGVMAYDTLGCSEDVSWFFGTFHSEIGDAPPDEREDSADWTATARLAWLPYFDEPSEGRYLVHVGGSYRYAAYGDDTVRYRVQPELATPSRFLDVTLAADQVNLFNAETALVWGPFSVQSEYFLAEVDTLVGPTATYTGAYAYVSYFLTGENRGYSRSAKAFDRVDVFTPFFHVNTCDGTCTGWGAWELAARWSYIDLVDGVALDAGTEGRLEHFTFGVNWYLNNYTRLMFNYVHSILDEADGDEGEADLFGVRFQVDF